MNTYEIKKTISTVLRQSMARLEDGTPLMELVADSFALVDMIIELQEQLDVVLVQQDLKGVITVGDLVCVLHSRSIAPMLSV